MPYAFWKSAITDGWVVGPVVDVENLLGPRCGGRMRSLARASRAGGEQRRQGCAEASGAGRADHDACSCITGPAAHRSDVQQQVLALPGADHLQKHLVLGFLDEGVGLDE